jgi:hypothetical protein
MKDVISSFVLWWKPYLQLNKIYEKNIVCWRGNVLKPCEISGRVKKPNSSIDKPFVLVLPLK